MSKLVAVYGSLRKGFGNNRLLSDSRLVGTTTVQDYGMVSLGYYPAVDVEVGSQITVEVYEVDERAASDLDCLEGFTEEGCPNNYYDKVEINTEFGKAGMYFISGVLDGGHTKVEDGDWSLYQSPARQANGW